MSGVGLYVQFLVKKKRASDSLRYLEKAKHSWVLCLHLCSELLAIKSGFTSLYQQGEMKEGWQKQEAKKEKEVGGVAIQSFANQAEKSCKGVRAKIYPSQILPPPWPASSSRIYINAKKNGGRAVQQSIKGGQHWYISVQIKNTPSSMPLLTKLSSIPVCRILKWEERLIAFCGVRAPQSRVKGPDLDSLETDVSASKCFDQRIE